MRNAFIDELYKIAERDERVVLLTGDLGYGVVDKFASSFPDRFYNMGIAEQNMVGTATGLAEGGFIPFVYSIAPFAILRPFEFIKNGPALHNLPVKIVGIGGGFEYGDLGYTHYCLEDIAVARVIPNISVYAPINNNNAADMLSKTYSLEGPAYYRVGKTAKSVTDEIVTDYNNGLEIVIEDKENRTCIIALSSSVEDGLNAIKSGKISANLYGLTKLSTVPEQLVDVIKKYSSVITVEAHYVNGGVGSIVSEIITDNNLSIRLTRLAVKQQVDGLFGDQRFMHKKYMISSDDIVLACKKNNE